MERGQSTTIVKHASMPGKRRVCAESVPRSLRRVLNGPTWLGPGPGSLLSARECGWAMSETLQQARPQHVPIPAESVPALLATAARAPSIFNTQPWLFRVTTNAIELYPDPSRRLRSDPSGREMLISCGAALFGLRLAIKALGYQPAVGLLPDPERPDLLARVRLGASTPMSDSERRLVDAL